jgi:hypothetical protein
MWLTKGGWLRRHQPAAIVALPLLSPTLDYNLALVVAVSGGHQPSSSVVVVVVVDVVLFVVVALRHSQSLVLSIFARYSDFRRPRSINKHNGQAHLPHRTSRCRPRQARSPAQQTRRYVSPCDPFPSDCDHGPRRLPDGWNVQVPSCWGTGQS